MTVKEINIDLLENISNDLPLISLSRIPHSVAGLKQQHRHRQCYSALVAVVVVVLSSLKLWAFVTIAFHKMKHSGRSSNSNSA